MRREKRQRFAVLVHCVFDSYGVGYALLSMDDLSLGTQTAKRYAKVLRTS
jgi:hypothetical protein